MRAYGLDGRGVEREIAENMLPGIAALAALAEGLERAALAARYHRLETVLRAPPV